MLLLALLFLYACDTPEDVVPYQGQTFLQLYGGNGSEEGRDLLHLPEGGFVMVG